MGFNFVTNALFLILVFTFHRLLGNLCTPISLHIFQLLLIANSGAAMHSMLTHAQSAYLCTARLPTCSLLVLGRYGHSLSVASL